MILQTHRLMPDFSSNNAGSFDFRAMRRAGIRASGQKATEGSFYVNPRYAALAEAQHEAGLHTVHYCFVRPGAGDPAGQIEHFLAVAVVRRGDRVVLDCELDNRRRRSPIGTELGPLRASVSETVQFMRQAWRVLVSNGHSGAVLYTGLAFLQQHGPGLIPPSGRCWIADYGNSSSTVESLWATCAAALKSMPGARLWAQQFAGPPLGPEPHTVPGAPGPCDVSVLSLGAYTAFAL